MFAASNNIASMRVYISQYVTIFVIAMHFHLERHRIYAVINAIDNYM